MALIIRGSSTCPICRRVIDTEDDVVATGPFLPRGHPLWGYSDAAMHRACFLAWENRVVFVAAFNSIVGPVMAPRGIRRQMLDDGSISDVVIDPELDAAWEQQSKEMKRTHEARTLAREQADAHWRGRPRACPQCETGFTSVQSRGACPSCGHVFDASPP
jgi:hypothetical protein